MLEIFKKSGSMLVLAGTFALSAGLVAASGCSGSSSDDDDATTEASPTPTATPAPETVDVKFVVDTNAKADGTNYLAKVESGEHIYMVGYFNGWTPQDTNYTLSDDGDGLFSITLTFPFAGKGTDGSDYTWMPGDTGFEYKFLKTTDADTGNDWGNGPKDYYSQVDKPCTAYPLATGTLWQITKPNGSLVNAGNNIYLEAIPNADTTVTYTPDAWEDYTVKTYEYPVCQ